MLICNLGIILDANALLAAVLATCDHSISILGIPGDIVDPSRGHLGAILKLSFVHLTSYRPSDFNKPLGLPMIAQEGTNMAQDAP